MEKFVVILTILCLVSIGYAGVIGDFEGAVGAEGWSGIGSPTPTITHSAIGATSGSQALAINTPGSGYWHLRWDATVIPPELTTLSFDLTMIQSEWTNAGQWTKVGDKIALGSDGAGGGWVEYVPTADNWTLPDGSPAPIDWGPWNPDESKTFTLDISDYDLTGATYFFIQIAIQGPDETGLFHIDNVRILDVARNPQPEDDGLAFVGITDTLSWTNAIHGLGSIEVWFGESGNSGTDPNLYVTPLNYKDKLTMIHSESNPDPNTTIPMPAIVDGQGYSWKVDGYVDGIADPNVYLGPIWDFTASTNISPEADAGPDLYLWPVNPDPNVITLDGSNSIDPDSGPEAITYSWTQIDGATVTIDTPDQAITTVTLPPGLASATEDGTGNPYVFELEVYDGEFSDTDTVTVSVNSNACTASIESGENYFWGDIAGPDGGGDDYRDCKVDIYDFAELAINWLNCSDIFELCD